MNILVNLLSEPSRVFGLADLQVDRVSGSDLASVLLGVAPGFFEGAVDRIALERQLDGAFLPFVDYQRWERGLEEAGAEGPYEPRDGQVSEWVTMARDDHFRGVLLPDDDAEEESASVFAWINGSRKALRLIRRGPDLHMSVNLSDHCSLPDEEGRCEAGLCGECRPRFQEVRGPGISCSCVH